MDWKDWLQTLLNAFIAGGLGYGQAWASGQSGRGAAGAAIVTGGAVLTGLFQRKPGT